MSLSNYSTGELLSEVKRRSDRLDRLRKRHYEEFCSKCVSNLFGMCTEVGGSCSLITGCIYDRKDKR